MQQKEMSGTQYHYVQVDAVAAATDASQPVWRAPLKCTITAITLIPAASITADGTNFATLTATRHTAGASAATVATRAWSATNSTIHTPEAMALSGTAANLILAANDTLTLVETHGGTGLALPAFGVQIAYQLAGI